MLAITNAYLLRSMRFAGGERLYHVMYEPPGPHEPRGMSEIDWGALRDGVDATVVPAGAAWYIGDAVRVALGAARRHVLRLVMSEAVLLCAGALALAALLTAIALKLLAPVIEL